MLALRQHELERRVAERTAELTTAAQNELMKQERYSAIGQLAASVAHELRNPLGAAQNTVHTIGDVAVRNNIDITRPIGRLERSLSRCERIIANLPRLCLCRRFEASRGQRRSLAWRLPRCARYCRQG